MGLILDTNVLIKAERTGQGPIFAQYAEYGEAYISVLTVSELLVGVHLANTKERKRYRAAYVEQLISTLPILDFTETAARIHAGIYADLRERGLLIGAHDLLIAATALEMEYPVLTANEKEFIRVPGLTVVSFKGWQ